MKENIFPTKDEFIKLAKTSTFPKAKAANLIPVYQEILADTETPIRVFKALRPDRYSFLLESVEGGERWSRYSFMGTIFPDY